MSLVITQQEIKANSMWKYIKEHLEATYHLLAFKKYTTLPRTDEIILGIQTWIYILGSGYLLKLIISRI
jgi:hypothetical protein